MIRIYQKNGSKIAMAENKEYITRQESMGTIQISEDVVASISSCMPAFSRL